MVCVLLTWACSWSIRLRGSRAEEKKAEQKACSTNPPKEYSSKKKTLALRCSLVVDSSGELQLPRCSVAPEASRGLFSCLLFSGAATEARAAVRLTTLPQSGSERAHAAVWQLRTRSHTKKGFFFPPFGPAHQKRVGFNL